MDVGRRFVEIARVLLQAFVQVRVLIIHPVQLQPVLPEVGQR